MTLGELAQWCFDADDEDARTEISGTTRRGKYMFAKEAKRVTSASCKQVLLDIAEQSASALRAGSEEPVRLEALPGARYHRRLDAAIDSATEWTKFGG